MKRIIFILALLCASEAWGATFYVSKTGSGSACTQPAPCLTIAIGIGKLAAGDTLEIAVGTYVESINDTIPSGSNNSVKTIIKAKSGDTVTLRPTTCAGPTGNGNIVYINGNSHIRLDGIIFDGLNCTGQGIYWDGVGTGNELLNSEVMNADGNCLTIQGDPQSNMIVRNNKIHDCGHVSPIGNDPAHGIYVHDSGHLFEHNEIYNITDGWGIHQFLSGSNRNDNNIYRYNYIHDNGGAIKGGGFLLGAGDDNLVHHNIIRDNSPADGIRIFQQSPRRNKIFNNTIYAHAEGSCIRVGTTSSHAHDTEVKNNLCLSNLTNTVNISSGSTGTVGACASFGNVCTTTTSHLVNVATNRFSPSATGAATLVNQGVNIAGFSPGKFVGSLPDVGALEAPVFSSAVVENGDANRVRVTFAMPSQSIRNGVGLIGCTLTNWTIVVAGSGAIEDGCALTQTTRSEPTVSTAVTSGQSVTVAYTSGTLTDNACIGVSTNCLHAEIRTFTAQSATNNVAGAPAVAYTLDAFRFVNIYSSVAAVTFRQGENVDGTCIPGGFCAFAVNIAFTAANPDLVTFAIYFNTNGGAYAVLTNDSATDGIAYGRYSQSGFNDGESIAAAIITNSQGSFTAGQAVAQDQTAPSVDCTQNCSTQFIVLLKVDATATPGTRYCFQPRFVGGTQLTNYQRTPCMDVVNPMKGGF